MWMWRVKPSIGWGPSTKSECGTSISSSSCCIHKHANQSSDQPKPNPTNQNPSNQTLTKWIFRKFKPVRSLWTRTETLGYQIMPKNTVTSKHDEKCTYMCERHRVRERRERERERELVCTSNGGGVIMVIGGERRTVRSMNLGTRWREKQWVSVRRKAKRAWQRRDCAEREWLREKTREGYFVSFRGNRRVFWE